MKKTTLLFISALVMGNTLAETGCERWMRSNAWRYDVIGKMYDCTPDKPEDIGPACLVLSAYEEGDKLELSFSGQSGDLLGGWVDFYESYQLTASVVSAKERPDRGLFEQFKSRTDILGEFKADGVLKLNREVDLRKKGLFSKWYLLRSDDFTCVKFNQEN